MCRDERDGSSLALSVRVVAAAAGKGCLPVVLDFVKQKHFIELCSTCSLQLAVGISKLTRALV